MPLKMVEVEEREIQSGGRITIPKAWREKHGLLEGTCVRMRDMGEKIEIEIPLKVASLYGLLEVEEPCDRPKEKAREHLSITLKKKLGES